MALARLIVRRRLLIAISWLLIAIAVGPSAARIETVLDVSANVPSSESVQVEQLLATRFHSPFAHFAILVATGVASPATEAGEQILRPLADSIAKAPGVTRVLSYLDGRDLLFVPRDGHDGTFLIVGLDAGRGPLDALVPALRETTERLATHWPSLTLRWTGEVPLNYDLRRTSADDARRAELRALPLTLALLGIAFGSIVAALLPVSAGALAIVVTLGVAAVMTTVMPLSIVLENVASMLGLGLGIDYALLMVSRFREARSRGATAEDAAVEATQHAGHTVLISGAAVVVGFAALLVVPLNEIRAIAAGGLLVALFSVLVATTLLPGVLAWLGERTEVGRVRRQRDGDGWLRLGAWIARHPTGLVVGLSIPVLILAFQARRLSTELPRGDWLPPKMESAQGVADLRGMGRSGVLQTIRVILTLPPGVTTLSADGWRATRALTDSLSHDPRVAAVRSLAAFSTQPDSEVFAALPADVRHSVVSDDGRLALIEVVPRETAEPEDLTRLVEQLREPSAATVTGVRKARLLIGGLPAFNVDYRAAINRQLPLVVLLVIGGTFIALLVGFRSVLIPLKAVALNLLTVGAAIGALTLVFQDGHLAWMVGLDHGVGSVFPAVPVLVFSTVFGLSMDYEVFLVARVGESRRAGRSESESLAEGLGSTGRVITSAAMIMVVVFGAFTMGDFLLVKMLGFALAVAVILDATVVRIALGPALLRLAGEWNWWPSAISRRSGRSGRSSFHV